MYALILYNLLMPQLEKKQVEPVKKKIFLLKNYIIFSPQP